MTGPEPGYVATPIFLLLCARELMLRRDRVARGVLPPAVAFSEGVDDMLQQLNEDGRIQWRIEDYVPQPQKKQ